MVTLNERAHRPTETKTKVRGVNRNSKETENYQDRNAYIYYRRLTLTALLTRSIIRRNIMFDTIWGLIVWALVIGKVAMAVARTQGAA